MEAPLLAGWDNFFVIVGSAAAGLTGLTFIVITLIAQGGRASPVGLQVFITPSIVHFSAVLGLSAFFSMPGQGPLTLSVSCGLVGAGGLSYVGKIAVGVSRMKGTYVPVREDWIWNVILPLLAYGALLAVAGLVWRWPRASVYGIAVPLVLFLLIGIHNAWDIAAWNSIRREADKPTAPSPPP